MLLAPEVDSLKALRTRSSCWEHSGVLTQHRSLPLLITVLPFSVEKLPKLSQCLWFQWDWAHYQSPWKYMWLRTGQSATLSFLVTVFGSGKGMRTRLGIFAGRTGQESTCKLEVGKLRAVGGHISTRRGEHFWEWSQQKEIKTEKWRKREGPEEKEHLEPAMPETSDSWTFLLYEYKFPLCSKEFELCFCHLQLEVFIQIHTKMYLPSYSLALFRIYITYLSLVSLNESVSFLKLGDKCDAADKITFFFFFFFWPKSNIGWLRNHFITMPKRRK